VVIIAINYFGVRYFGEFEFWLSSIKVIVICAVILLSLILALGGGPNHDKTGFRYYHNPGAFKPYIESMLFGGYAISSTKTIVAGSAGKFLGFWSSMITAVFAYLGKLIR